MKGELALDLSGRLVVILSEVETLTPGRMFGPQMYRRLQRSIETLHRVAEGTPVTPRR